MPTPAPDLPSPFMQAFKNELDRTRDERDAALIRTNELETLVAKQGEDNLLLHRIRGAQGAMIDSIVTALGIKYCFSKSISDLAAEIVQQRDDARAERDRVLAAYRKMREWPRPRQARQDQGEDEG